MTILLGNRKKINIYSYDILMAMKIVSLPSKEAAGQLSLFIKDERNKLCHISLGTIQKDLTKIDFQTKMREIKNKLNEEDYGQYHLQDAEERITLYSRKFSQ